MVKTALVAILAVALWVGSLLGAFKLGMDTGLDSYHEMCYTSGPGFVIDEDDGTAVLCGPMTKIPEEELNKYKQGV